MYETRSASQRSESDVRDFATSVASTLGDLWSDAVAAPEGDLARVHAEGAEQGWFDLGPEHALDFLIAATRELGARACPLPLADGYVVSQLLPESIAEEISNGTRKVLVLDVRARTEVDALAQVEGAAGATHVLLVDQERARLHAVTTSTALPGLAVPAWHRLEVGEAELVITPVAEAWRVLAPVRLAVAARAVAAANRMHELAVQHAVVRHQFGRPVGAFGAVQQRTAATQIDVMAADALIDEAVRALLSLERDPLDVELAVETAVTVVRDCVTRIGFNAQHTLGAIGFFEEHQASWLFRRVHADSLLLGAADGRIASLLVGEERGLPALDLGPRAETFRGEVHALLARHTGADGVIDAEGLRVEMARERLFAMGWPEADGGLAGTVEEQVVLHEELKYAGGPVDRAMSATMLLGHSLLRHGSPAQKEQFLPLIRDGRMAFCLGYSEPEAGSDLASLRTRAVRDGDDWVISGQKSWTTRAQTASHVWLAVRTDPDAAKPHAGITIFLVGMDTPGIEVQQHVALSGEISCTVFYDQVRVPDSARVGEVNGGWRVITDALAAERVVMGGVAAVMRRNLDALLAVLRERQVAGVPLDAAAAVRLGSLASRLQAARVLVVRATRAMEGTEARTIGPVAAVLSGELAEELAEATLALLGPAGALTPGSAGALGAAGTVDFDGALRVSPMFVIGGGTNDVQRGIIARALGLPRE